MYIIQLYRIPLHTTSCCIFSILYYIEDFYTLSAAFLPQLHASKRSKLYINNQQLLIKHHQYVHLAIVMSITKYLSFQCSKVSRAIISTEVSSPTLTQSPSLLHWRRISHQLSKLGFLFNEAHNTDNQLRSPPANHFLLHIAVLTNHAVLIPQGCV